MKIVPILRGLCFLFLWEISTSLHAQNLVFFGTLPAFSSTFRFSEQWEVGFFCSTTIDAIPMKVNEVLYPAKDLQLYIQPSVLYRINPDWSIAASYTYQRNNPITDDYSNEHRFWEQVAFAHSVETLRFGHRLRIEERFIENRQTELYPFSLRLRYQLSATAPFASNSAWYWTAFNEWYASVVGARNADYSENWTFAGVGCNVTPTTRLEAGYLLQFFVRDAAKDIRMLNLLQVVLATNISFVPPQR